MSATCSGGESCEKAVRRRSVSVGLELTLEGLGKPCLTGPLAFLRHGMNFGRFFQQSSPRGLLPLNLRASKESRNRNSLPPLDGLDWKCISSAPLKTHPGPQTSPANHPSKATNLSTRTLLRGRERFGDLKPEPKASFDQESYGPPRRISQVVNGPELTLLGMHKKALLGLRTPEDRRCLCFMVPLPILKDASSYHKGTPCHLTVFGVPDDEEVQD